MVLEQNQLGSMPQSFGQITGDLSSLPESCVQLKALQGMALRLSQPSCLPESSV